jgi:signal transduction histidine kinase
MLIGDLLPAALAAWKPRRATQATDVQFSRPIAAPRRPVTWGAAALPRGMALVERETQAALAAVSDYARTRFVELQIAVEAGLVVQAEPADYRTCLGNLLLGAISRAVSGVLVTAMRRVDGVEITVLDDGTASAGARPDGSTRGVNDPSVPAGGTLGADYHPQRGTTVRLRLPQPDGLPVPSDADADDEIRVYAAL